MSEVPVLPEKGKEEEYTVKDLNRALEEAVSALDDAEFIARQLCGEPDMLIEDWEVSDILSELQELTNRSEGIDDDE